MVFTRNLQIPSQTYGCDRAIAMLRSSHPYSIYPVVRRSPEEGRDCISYTQSPDGSQARTSRISKAHAHQCRPSRALTALWFIALNLLYQGLEQYDLSYDDVEALVWSGVLNQESQTRQTTLDLRRLSVTTRI